MDDEEKIRPGKARVITVIMVGILIYLVFGPESKIFRFSIIPVFFSVILYFTGFKLPKYQVDPRKLRASIMAGLGGSILFVFSLLWLQQKTNVEIHPIFVWIALPITYIVFSVLVWKII